MMVGEKNKRFVLATMLSSLIGGMLGLFPVSGVAQSPPPVAIEAPQVIASKPIYCLEDCLRIAHERQPAIHAARASLAAAQTAQRGLSEIKFGQIFARDLPIRKQQSCLGVSVAAANLAQVEFETTAAVTRLYFGAIHAREQRQVADRVVQQLMLAVKTGQTLMGTDAAPPDLNQIGLEKARAFAAIAETQQATADRGLNRALAALREAMGVGPDCAFDIQTVPMPKPVVGVVKEQVIELAVSRRGEVSQASLAASISCLEIEAQSRSPRVKVPTFASGADIHAKAIPYGTFGDDYRPGALGLEFPTMFAGLPGPRSARVERAKDLAARAGSVVEKTRNLVALEAEDAFLKWEESSTHIEKLKAVVEKAESAAQKTLQGLLGGVVSSYRDVIELQVITAQAQAQLNKAYYDHLIALTEIERVTAGGIRVILVPESAKDQPQSK